MGFGQRLGRAVGYLLAPVTAAGTAARRARLFHPEGLLFSAEVLPLTHGHLGAVAERLIGPALVRFSAAFWRGERRWPELLGCAIRFRESREASATPSPGDQDLLFATVRRPWTLPRALLATRRRDFLANVYHGVSPFDAAGVGRLRWRLVPERSSPAGFSRADRLARAVAAGGAILRLEARLPGAFGRYEPVAAIHLRARSALDPGALRFSPFQTGRGIHPVGFVHGLRAATYRASQAARRRAGRARG